MGVKEYTRIAVEDAIYASSRIKKYLKEFDTHNSNFQKTIDLFCGNKKNYDSDAACDFFCKELANTSMQMHDTTEKIYSVLEEGVLRGERYWSPKEENPYLKDEVFSSVKAIVNSEYILIKTPPLKSRYQRTCYTKSGKVNHKYSFNFAKDVECALKTAKENVPDFEEKSIEVYANYPKNQYEIPDPDNLDAKKIIDKITQNFTTGDGYGTTTIAFYAGKTKNIEAGTYFFVQKGLMNFKKIDELQALILENFGKEI